MAADAEEKPTRRGWNWLLWWRIDSGELQKQVQEYHTLKVYQSARGISVLCLLFSVLLTIALIVWAGADIEGLADCVIMLVLAAFIYFGHRWAMVAAMVLWTFEKAYLAISPLIAGATPNPIAAIIWWAIYMHAFYLAFQVEKRRQGSAVEVEAFD